MIDESRIPLLEDLVLRGQLDNEHQEEDQSALDGDDMHDLQITDDGNTDDLPDEITASETEAVDSSSEQHKDELEDDASLRELIIDEEIRLILDRHMDKAYEEIIRLLNHKIS